MLIKYLRIFVAGASLLGAGSPAAADWLYTPGAGPSKFMSYNAGTTPVGTGNCAATNVDCMAYIPITPAGAALFVTGGAGLVTGTGGTFPATESGTWTVQPGNTANTTAWLVTGTGGTFPATQATAANLNATVVGTGTFATQLTGATNNINNIAGTISLPTGAATSANQTNASQKSQIVDGSGNVIASTSNNLNVQCANCSGSGVSAVDAATFTAGTSLFAPIGGQFTSGGATPCVTGHECTVGMTADRAMSINLMDIQGTSISTGSGVVGIGSQRITVGGDAATIAGSTPGPATQNAATPSNGQLAVGQFNTTPTTITSGNVSPLQMDSAGNLLVNIKAGAGSGGTALADNAAFTQGTTSMTPIGCFFTSGSYSAITTLHAGVLSCTSAGSLHTTVDNTNTNVNANGDGVTAAATWGSPTVGENFVYNGSTWDRMRTFSGVTGAAVPAGAAYMAGDALSAEPTAATTGNLTGAFLDLAGKLVTSPYANRENMLRCAVTITASTSATTCTGMGAQGAGVKIYLTDVTCTRNDAGTTAVTATLNDSQTTIVDLPNNGGGGGYSHPYLVPLVVAANTAFQVTIGTSISSAHCSASGFKGY